MKETSMSTAENSTRTLLLTALLAERSRPLNLKDLLSTASFTKLLPTELPKNDHPRAVEAAAGALENEKLLQRTATGAFALTAEGKQRGLAFIGARKNYPKLGWDKATPQGISIRNSYLPAKALGVHDEIDERALRRLAKVEYLRGEIIRRRFELDLPIASHEKSVREELGWKLLEVGANAKVIADARRAGKFNSLIRVLDALMCSVAGRDFRAGKGFETLAAETLKTSDLKSNALYDILARRALETEAPRSFAEEAQRAAAKVRDGRVGESLVFVSHAWRQFVADGNSITLEQFKSKLLEAHRSHSLTLAKADMPQTLNRADVTASETKDRNIVFIFIRVSA